jgi:hypothetical protein
MFRKTLHVDTHGFVLTNFVAFFGTLGNWNQKVLNSFVVNLKHRQLDFVLLVRVVIGCDSSENLLA